MKSGDLKIGSIWKSGRQIENREVNLRGNVDLMGPHGVPNVHPQRVAHLGTTRRPRDGVRRRLELENHAET